MNRASASWRTDVILGWRQLSAIGCGTTKESMEIQFTTRIFREGRTFVAHAQELDISSCGRTKQKAFANLKDAVRLFLEEAEKMGTLETILEEAGYKKTKATLRVPKPISVQRVSLPVPLTHVKV
jgi:predicted RNase H-like HicB family nuclease